MNTTPQDPTPPEVRPDPAPEEPVPAAMLPRLHDLQVLAPNGIRLGHVTLRVQPGEIRPPVFQVRSPDDRRDYLASPQRGATVLAAIEVLRKVVDAGRERKVTAPAEGTLANLIVDLVTHGARVEDALTEAVDWFRYVATPPTWWDCCPPELPEDDDTDLVRALRLAGDGWCRTGWLDDAPLLIAPGETVAVHDARFGCRVPMRTIAPAGRRQRRVATLVKELSAPHAAGTLVPGEIDGELVVVPARRLRVFGTDA